MGERPIGFIPDAPAGFVPDTPGSAPKAPSGGASGFAEEFWKRANPLSWASGLIDAAKHPVDTVGNLIKADPQFLVQAKEAADKGDHYTAARKVLSYLSMGLGHDLDAQSDLIQHGDYARAAGAMTGTATQFLAPEAAARAVTAVPVLRGVQPANPAVAQAVQFGKDAGVPLDAATATDNAAVRAVQHLSDRSLGGAQVAGKATQAQAQGLATIGEQLAARVHPNPITPELAGQGVRDALHSKVADLGSQADASYGRLRAIEAQQPIPVNLAPVKAALEPMYKTYAVGADIAPLQGAKASAVRAMARILEGPDVAMASEVDSALSDLKALQRDTAGTPGAAAANQAVAQVHQALLRAVSSAGPDALKALQEGRAATTSKYAVQDVYDAIRNEPVQAFNKAIAPQDSAVAQLRDVATHAPDELPKIGRAYLDRLLETATSDGGFTHTDKLWADWQKMGPETKRLLFDDPTYVKDLDQFFLLARQINKNANPSGTAHAVAMLAQGSQLTNPLNFVASVAGTAGLSSLLHSSAGVRLLTEGLRAPSLSPAWLEKLRQLSAAQGVVLQAAPSTASPQG